MAAADRGGCNNNSANSSGNNSVLNCKSHSSSLEAAVTSVGIQNASRHNILVSPLTTRLHQLTIVHFLFLIVQILLVMPPTNKARITG